MTTLPAGDAAAFVDLPPPSPRLGPGRGGVLWHLVAGGILSAGFPLSAWTSREAGTLTWHLSGSCSAAGSTTVTITAGDLVEQVAGAAAEALLCECERPGLVSHPAFGPVEISALRFLTDTDLLPASAASARLLRTRLRTLPLPEDVPALARRVRQRADLRWQQLAAAPGDLLFQADCLDHIGTSMRRRGTARPALWGEAVRTWESAGRSDQASGLTQRPAREVDYLATQQGRVHDMVWEALTSVRAWVRSAAPADGVAELASVFAEDTDHRFLLVPAAAVESAEVVCADRGYVAADVAVAAGLCAASGAPVGDMVEALLAARLP